MKIQIGDTVKVKDSKTGRHFKVVELWGQLVLANPDNGSQVRIGLAPANLVIIARGIRG